MDIWYKYTDDSERQLFTSLNDLNHCCRPSYSPKTISPEEQEKLQKTINKVFSPMSYYEFVKIFQEKDDTNNNILKYIAGNFCHHISNLCHSHESQILYRAEVLDFVEITSELEKYPEIPSQQIFSYVMMERFPYPYGLCRHRGVIGSRGCFIPPKEGEKGSISYLLKYKYTENYPRLITVGSN